MAIHRVLHAGSVLRRRASTRGVKRPFGRASETIAHLQRLAWPVGPHASDWLRESATL
jgi:hypothetical protein